MDHKGRRDDLCQGRGRETLDHGLALSGRLRNQFTQGLMGTRPGAGLVAGVYQLLGDQRLVIGEQRHQLAHIAQRWFVLPGAT
ncbi:hypothetical protein D3C76_1038480 [compost metagenome]